jgi:uncharacterized protein (DUF427 family)
MPHRIEPGPGQESVWDYPRPPRVEPVGKHICVVFNGNIIADTRRALRVLETSHPPVYYIPLEDVQQSALEPISRRSFCEFKGQATYWTVHVGDRVARDAAWSYPQPTTGFAALKDHVAFYAGKMDECTVDGEHVQTQDGDFYGGWITSDIVGPFKGGPGTIGW